MFLIFLQGLEWAYTAEVASILFVQLVMSVFACKRVMTMLDACVILALYPASLIIVVVLEAAGFD